MFRRPFPTVQEALLDPARVPCGHTDYRDPCSQRLNHEGLDEGVNDRSRRVSDLDSCIGNSWNCTPNTEPRIQRAIAPGKRNGGAFTGPNLKFNRCLGRHGSRTRHPSTEMSTTVPYRGTQRLNNESVNKEKDEMGVLQEGIARAWTRRSDFDSAQVIDTIWQRYASP